MTDIFWEELGSTLFEEAGDGLFLFDPESEQIAQVNPMAQRLSGFTSRELTAMKITQLIRSEIEGGLQKMRLAFRRTGIFHSQEGFWLRNKKDGFWIPVNLTITRLHTEPKVYGLITARDISERREAHARLQESEERYRTLFETSMQGIVIHQDGVIRFGNQALAQMFGYDSPVELIGKDVWKTLVMPHEWPLLHERTAASLRGEKLAVHPGWQGIRKDGAAIWVQASGSRILWEGKPAICDFFVDVTERRRAEEQLRSSEQRHRLMLEQLPAIVWTTDPEFRFTSGLGAGLTTMGVRPNDAVGYTLYDYFQSNDPNYPPFAAHRRALQGENVTYEIAWGGRTWHSHVEPLRDAEDSVVGVIGVGLDITDRVQAEYAVRSSEAKYRTLIENLSQSVFLKDKELRFIAVNEPFCRSFGKSQQELLGKDDYFLFPAHLADKYRGDDRRVMEERRRVEVEEHTLMHGKMRTVQTVKTPVLDGQGQPIGVLGIFWDVTDQRNLEAQLRQAHKMEAVGQLAGGIAHDFNNLLTGILGNLSLALADLPAMHPCRDLLGNAEGAALRAAELTRQLLGFSRRTPLIQKAISLNTVIEETIRLLQRTFDPRINIEVACAADLWSIQADSGSMGQVLMNLCLNARDAMPRGGKLVIQTENRRLDQDAANRTTEGQPGDYVHLQVRDTGVGMMPEVRERIFEPFFTTKEPGKGTGLGLAMVFGIVKAHSGWIECQSEAGRGTSFDVYLPAVKSASAAPPATSPDGIRGGNETILLADDEAVVGRLGETILKRHGYRVLSVVDGVEAVQVFRERHREIDLVILDLSMPRLSGAETLRELRKIDPRVHVLISSGYSSEEDLRAIEREGVLGFVAKPYRPLELARQVRAALDQIAEDASAKRR